MTSIAVRYFKTLLEWVASLTLAIASLLVLHAWVYEKPNAEAQCNATKAGTTISDIERMLQSADYVLYTADQIQITQGGVLCVIDPHTNTVVTKGMILKKRHGILHLLF